MHNSFITAKLWVTQFANLHKGVLLFIWRSKQNFSAAGIRSTVTGLVGNTLNVDSLSWVRFDASIGAGVDSFYEYLLKVRPPAQRQPFGTPKSSTFPWRQYVSDMHLTQQHATDASPQDDRSADCRGAIPMWRSTHRQLRGWPCKPTATAASHQNCLVSHQNNAETELVCLCGRHTCSLERRSI